jgi:hypothetical protein
MVFWVSPSFFFPERLHCCYIDFHCSYLYNYDNSSQTLCIKCWDSAFRSEFQHFILRFPYFTDTTKRGVRGWKTGWNQGEDRVNFWIFLMHILLESTNTSTSPLQLPPSVKKISVVKQQTKQIFPPLQQHKCKTLLTHTQPHCCHNKSANTSSPNSFSRPAANTLNPNTTKDKNLADQNPKPNL